MLIVSGVSLIAVNFSHAQNYQLPKGVHAEEIEGMLHQVEYHYGAPLTYSWQEMLKEKSVDFYPEDRISAFPDPKLGLGSQIVIKRANQIVINDAGQQKTVRTWANNIDGVLAENNIAIGESDIISPAKDKTLASLVGSEHNVVSRDGRENSNPTITEITITRVSNTEVREQEEIAYKTITKEDNTLEKGTTKKEQVGKKGTKELTYKIRRENNQEVEKKLVKNEILRQAQDEVILKGTKVVVYGTGTATWYDWIGGMTAASNTLPQGTIVKVVNLENGKSVEVKIVDHGIKGSAIIDLSDTAFSQLAPLNKGTIKVRVEKP